MIGRIYAIALNTFREAIRRRVVLGIIIAVVAINLAAIIGAQMVLYEDVEARLARDAGLAGVSLFGAFTAIYLGVSLLYTEIQRKTIYPIIAKPIERYEFVLGKFLGMAATLTLLVGVFALFMWLHLTVKQVAWTPALTKALVLAYGEVLVVAAIAIFFSSFSTPFLSGIFTGALFALGRCTPEMRAAASDAKISWARSLADVALKVVLDLHLYKASGGVVQGRHVSVHADFVDWSYVVSASGYGLMIIGVLLTLSILIFARRNFV